MPRRTLVALLCLAMLTACGTPTPTPAPRAEQIAQLTQVAQGVRASAEARAATPTAQAQPTVTPTAAPTRTVAPTPTSTPTSTRPATMAAPPTARTTPGGDAPGGGGGPSRAPTATPLPALPTTVGTAALLPYFDPLTDPASGWVSGDLGVSRLAYAPDGYHMRIDKLGSWLEAPNRALPRVADSAVAVDVTNLAGPAPGNGFGVLCRYQDPRNWYGLTFGADGRYRILRMRNGVESTLAAPAAGATSPLLPAPGATARLRADCVGDTLTLLADGQVVAQARDDSFATGTLELYACTCGLRGTTEVRFADLVAWQPDPTDPHGPEPTRP